MGFQATKQDIRTFLFFDLPKPVVFIGFQAPKIMQSSFSLVRPRNTTAFIAFQPNKQYSQALLFFDLPMCFHRFSIKKPLQSNFSILPNVFIGFQTKKQYSLAFLLLDLSKPMVFIGVLTQK